MNTQQNDKILTRMKRNPNTQGVISVDNASIGIHCPDAQVIKVVG